MPLLNDLLDFSDHPLMPPPSAQLFAEHLPTEWIQHCLTLSAHATVRRRRLPGTWLSGWWCNEPITDVVRRLNLSADGEAMNLLARSAVTQRVSAWGRPSGMALPPDRTDRRGTLPEG